MLNDLTRRENMYHCEFRDQKDMTNFCHYVWKRFFWHHRPGVPLIDLAIWEIGETVSVRHASTELDESSPDFVRPHPLYFSVRGYRQERRKTEKRKDATPEEVETELQALEAELLASMEQAIVQSLGDQAAEAYREFNPDQRPFTALTTTRDAGLHASEFQIAWKNERGPTLATVRKRATAARGKKLPTQQRGPSPRQQHLQELAQRKKQEAQAAKKYWADQKKKGEQRKPAAREKLARQIQQAMAKQPQPKEKRKSSGEPARGLLLSLDDGNQHDLRVAPDVSLEELVAIHLGHKWSNFDEYDNRMWEYCYKLLDPAVQKARAKRMGDLWRKLNRAQKVFFTFRVFVGEVDNGGVWQFLFNNPELACAALEMMHEIGARKLANDYQTVLGELVGKGDSVSKLRKRFNDRQLDSAKRWQAFAEGYGQLKSAQPLEKYFYTSRFKRSLFRSMSDYVESSFHRLAKVTDLS